MDSIKESNLLNMNFASNTRQIRERYWVLSGKNSASSIQYLQYIDLHQNCCMHFWSHCIPKNSLIINIEIFLVLCAKHIPKNLLEKGKLFESKWVWQALNSVDEQTKRNCFLFHSADILYTNQYHQVMLNVSIFAPILKNSNSCCSKNFELSN